MFGKVGNKLFMSASLVSVLGLPLANAGLKQLEIKGRVSTVGHTIDFGDHTESTTQLDTDLDFKMKFSQDVSARIDLELDNANAGDAVEGIPNRYAWGVDQAYVKMNDFLFRNFSLQVGKQDLNISLRDNNSNNWAWGDPIGVVGTYSTRDMDLKVYYLKYNDGDLNSDSINGTNSNDEDENLFGTYGEYWLNDDSLITGYLNYKNFRNGVETNAGEGDFPAGTLNRRDIDNLIHYGLGIDYFIGESLEIYAEVAAQKIDGGDNNGEPFENVSEGSAYQLNLGGEYTFSDHESKPQLSLEYYVQSGQDSGDPAWQNIGGGFAAADTDSIFMERNGHEGRDLNPNVGPVAKGRSSNAAGGYSVLRINGSMSLSKSTKIGIGIHLFSSEDDITGGDDDLGTEHNLYGMWKYSQDIIFNAGLYLVSDPTFTVNEEDITGAVLGTALVF